MMASAQKPENLQESGFLAGAQVFIRRYRSKLIVVPLIAASAIPLLGAYHQHANFLNEDTYISLTYVKNIVNGNGFVFNHPPATLGTTSPLFVLLVAGLTLLLPFLEIQTVAVFFTALCWVGTGWIIYLFRRAFNLSDWQAVVVGLALVTTGWVPFLGMEMYLFLFLLVLGAGLFFARHHLLAGLAVGLLFLARGEGVLMLAAMVAALFISECVQKKKLSAGPLIKPIALLLVGFLAPVILWSIYALMTFGALLPNTLAAKMVQGQIPGFWNNFFYSELVYEWAPKWAWSFPFRRFPVWWIFVAAGLVYAFIRNSRLLLFLAWVLLFIAGYSVLGVPPYWWYQVPILFVLQIFGALGLVWATGAIAGRQKLKTLCTFVSVCLVFGFIFSTGRSTFHSTYKYGGDTRGAPYTQLSSWLRENTKPSESVAYLEIGYIGFFTENRIIDLAGLVDPEIVAHLSNEGPSWGFWRRSPDYFIRSSHFDLSLATIIEDQEFKKQYQPVFAMPGAGEDVLLTIYERKR